MRNWFSRTVLSTAALVLFGCVALPAQVLKGSRGEAYSPQWGGFLMESLRQQLKLTPQQQTQIKPILENEQTQFAQIHQNSARKIEPLLNADQQKRFGEAYSPQWGGRRAGKFVPAYSPQWGGFILQHLTQELKLSKEQQARIGPVLTQTQNEFQAAHEKAGGEIANVLAPEQKTRFKTISQSRE